MVDKVAIGVAYGHACSMVMLWRIRHGLDTGEAMRCELKPAPGWKTIDALSERSVDFAPLWDPE